MGFVGLREYRVFSLWASALDSEGFNALGQVGQQRFNTRVCREKRSVQVLLGGV